MKKEKILNLILLISVLLLITAIFFYGYSQNWFRAKTQVIRIQDKTTVIKLDSKIVDVTDRNRIAKQIMKQTHVRDGLTKMGFVSIPKIGALLPIFDKPYSKKGLSAGANQINPISETATKAIAGQGNYILTAHNYDDGRTAFSGLQETINEDSPYLKSGKPSIDNWLNNQHIYIANKQGIYDYVITGQTSVEKDDTSVLGQSGTSVLTIITCLYPNNQYRIITKADLKNIYSWNKVPDDVVNLFDLQVQRTNAHASWFNQGLEEGSNGSKGQ